MPICAMATLIGQPSASGGELHLGTELYLDRDRATIYIIE